MCWYVMPWRIVLLNLKCTQQVLTLSNELSLDEIQGLLCLLSGHDEVRYHPMGRALPVLAQCIQNYS